MPIPPQLVASVFPKAAEIAWWVYRHGFNKADPPHTQYSQFGTEIRSLYQNLKTVKDLIVTVNRQRDGPLDEDEFDLTPLSKIFGDFTKTLAHCRVFLEENNQFVKDKDGFVKRVQWSSQLADQVEGLRRRIVYHNIRLAAALKPLELTFYSELRDEIRKNYKSLTAQISELKGIILKNVEHDLDDANRPLRDLPPVPRYLSSRFEDHAGPQEDVLLDDDVRISSIVGHFEDSTVKIPRSSPMGFTAAPLSYVSLMKCVWIMQKLKSSIRPASMSDLKVSMVLDLERKILGEIDRFDTNGGDLVQPLEDEVRLPYKDYYIWIFEEQLDTLPSLTTATPFETKIFERSLLDPSRTQTQDLVVLTTMDEPHILRIVSTLAGKIDGTSREQGYVVDAEKVQLVPTYGTPEAELHSVQLKSSRLDRLYTAFNFRSRQDLFEFQRCITGYKVNLHQPGLTNVMYKSGSFSRGKSAGNKGTLQIWDYDQPTSDMTSSIATIRPPRSPHVRQASFARSGSPALSSSRNSNKASKTSSRESAPAAIVEWSKTNAPTLRKSTTQLFDGALTLTFPVPPLLVVLLAVTDKTDEEETDLKKLRFLSFTLDDPVTIDKSQCECRRPDAGCTKVVIVSRSSLDAKLHDFETEGNQWNIAALRHPRHDEQDSCVEDLTGLVRITIEFGTVLDKIEFWKCFNDVKDNYIGLCDEYRASKSKVHSHDEISRRLS